jgi:hypothetical protein
VCPPCTTETVTDCPVQTPCPDVTSTTEEILNSTCPACPTEITTQCPEVTTKCPEITTQCPEVTKPEECTPCSSEDTANTASSSSASGILQDVMGFIIVPVFPCSLFIDFYDFIFLIICVILFHYTSVQKWNYSIQRP